MKEALILMVTWFTFVFMGTFLTGLAIKLAILVMNNVVGVFA